MACYVVPLYKDGLQPVVQYTHWKYRCTEERLYWVAWRFIYVMWCAILHGIHEQLMCQFQPS